MRNFLQRRAAMLVGEARQLAARGATPKACRRVLETCIFLRHAFGATHGDLPELVQLLSDLHHARGEYAEAQRHQTHAWELRLLQARYCRRLTGISRLDADRTIASADLGRWPPAVQTLVHQLRNDPDPGSTPEVLILGPPRSGKSHLLHALGHEAIRRPWATRVFLGGELLATLLQARRALSLRRCLYRLDRYVVLLVDELDLLRLSREESVALRTLLRHRRDCRCTMLAVRFDQGVTAERDLVARWRGRRRQTLLLAG